MGIRGEMVTAVAQRLLAQHGKLRGAAERVGDGEHGSYPAERTAVVSTRSISTGSHVLLLPSLRPPVVMPMASAIRRGNETGRRSRPPSLPIVMRAGCVWEMLSFPHADHPSTMRTLPARYPVSSGCFSTASRSNSSTAYSGPGSTTISSRACIQIDPRRLTRDGADRVAASRGAGAAD